MVVIASDRVDLRREEQVSASSIVFILWSGKWIILSFMLIFLAFGGLFAFKISDNIRLRVDLDRISLAELAPYRYLNSILFEATPIGSDQKNSVLTIFFPIGPDDLLDRLVEDLQNRATIAHEVKALAVSGGQALDPVNESFNYRIDTTKSSAPNSEVSQDVFIEYRGSQPEADVRTVIENALLASTENVRKGVVGDFQREVSIRQRDNAFLSKQLGLDIANAIADYDVDTNNRIEALTEQSRIARALGIEKNAIEVQKLGVGSSLLSTMQQSPDPYYMRGYAAIDEEIRLIQNRTDKFAFVDGLVELQRKKRSIEQDSLVERATQALDRTPVMTGSFKAASYDVAGAEVTKSTIKAISVVLASAIVGAVVGVAILLLASVLRYRAPASFGQRSDAAAM